MSTTSLIQELRKRVKDSRTVVRAFGISVSDPASTAATVEVAGGYLRVEVFDGTASSLALPLINGAYDTLGKLTRAIASEAGYIVSPDSEMDEDFESASLSSIGPIDCLRRQVDLSHRLFSETLLADVLRRALLRHNPSMPNPDALPVGEEEFVLTLAHATLMRQLATDSSRKRGLSMSTVDLLALAEALEKTYYADTKRLARAIQSPREASSNIMREGDIVIGSFSRRLRNGRYRSIGNIPPEAPVLLDPLTADVEDDRVYLSWQRSADDNFLSYELWRGTDSGVTKDRSTYTRSTFVPLGAPNGRDALGSTGGWVDGLEPNTTYFFRLYVIDRNGEYTGSQVLQVQTLDLRSSILSTTPPTPSTVVAGDLITVTFDPLYAAPTSNLDVFIGEKAATFTVTGAHTIDVTVPAFFQKGQKVLRVVSPNGLVSCYSPILVN